MIDFGREITGQPHTAITREWLVTNGIGGYSVITDKSEEGGKSFSPVGTGRL